VLPDDPELRRHAANAIARSKPRGWKIEAPDPSSNVDAIVALIWPSTGSRTGRSRRD
jgi:hypothetical protein